MVLGGGHATTLTIRAVKRGAVKPKVIAAIAPTWAGLVPFLSCLVEILAWKLGILSKTLVYMCVWNDSCS